ncbi:hypothetical protein BJ878DRAFT_311048 [Calycina marina]|uniref:DUF5672 domain-containing protein n=1 Tax=Calycina marina TaxID=1763456 RepID=A0A9P7Z6E2_9HELO|nr:hypothetical protein BJ878DRAFT_311048 [Calycina marina]
MSGILAGTSNSGIVTKQRFLVALSLALTWAFAAILHSSYKDTIKVEFKNKWSDYVEHLPTVEVDWHPAYDPKSQFNASKVALIIEGRPLPHLVPQLLHMMTVVPPDWRFKFIGSNQSVIAISRSFATQYHEANGKLDLIVLPEPWKIDNKEDVNRLLTDRRFYNEHMSEVEHMLKFENDAILCANSEDSLNDWLKYDWAGAPRSAGDRFAGNGGLSIRRISVIKKVLEFQERYNDTQPEDEWFGKRLITMPGAIVATGEQEERFSVEAIWHPKPLGFHVPEGGMNLADDVWKDPTRRKHNFEYCPELVMIMPMKLERERCNGDNKQGDIVR